MLQKAARRGYPHVVELALGRLHNNGDKTWLRSRTIVITFEECWPLAASLSISRELSSKRAALLGVTNAAKQKDAAGLGALAYAYQEGDQSMLDCVPDPSILRIVSEALQRPRAFFKWVLGQSRARRVGDVISSAERYLSAATWQWDKACILAGAVLATIGDMPTIESVGPTSGDFPYWVALDKHTPEGKVALAEVAKQVHTSYRRLIWASFYYESACVNRLLTSPWWEAEKTWRLRRAGLSPSEAGELWSRASSLVRERLLREAASLKVLVETAPSSPDIAIQNNLLL
ncbi:MAG: hypothetical protein L0338_17770 [Acidobacteria bacterium]|nr:hypothetical protein [Acidobacteriota bacterium]